MRRNCDDLGRLSLRRGALTRLPDALLAEVLDSVGAAIDAIGGSIAVQYTTVTVIATLVR